MQHRVSAAQVAVGRGFSPATLTLLNAGRFCGVEAMGNPGRALPVIGSALRHGLTARRRLGCFERQPEIGSAESWLGRP